MKLSVKTTILRYMVSRAVKGASCNKLIPITSLMAIKLADSKLTLITTDSTNTLYIARDGVEGDDFNCVVQVEQFSNLIMKMSCETTVLEIVDNVLNVKGNGNYKIELPFDENGNMINYPSPIEMYKADSSLISEKYEISMATMGKVIDMCMPSLATSLETPCYTGMYMGDCAIATDTCKVASLDADILGNSSVLITPEMLKLVDLMQDDTVEMQITTDGKIIFTDSDCTVVGSVLDGIEDFDVDAIKGLLDIEFTGTCKVYKADLIKMLDRIALFVGAYDMGAIQLKFGKDGLTVQSTKSSGVETIAYIDEIDIAEPVTCYININMLLDQIKVQKSDITTISFGNSKALKMVDGDLTQVIALIDKY